MKNYNCSVDAKHVMQRCRATVYTGVYKAIQVARSPLRILFKKKKTGTGKRSFNLLDLSYFKFEIITIFYTMASSL